MVTTRSRTAGTTASSTASSTAAAASTKKTTSSSAATSKPASAPKKTTAAAAAAPASSKALSVGDALPESTPELTVHSGKEGETTSLGALVDASAKGIVVFFYPAANTPGCTNQAKLFQENLSKFTDKGYTVYGCSKDKPAAQTKWHTKLSLDYDLLTDTNSDTAELVGLLKQPGRKMSRGVAIIDKDGGRKVVFAGAYGPQASVDEALKFVGAA